MASSKIYPLLLAGLLPVIALLIYFEGQHYDSALVRFESSQSEAGSMASFFPPEVGSYSLLGQVRSYAKENLYEYVDGHAEYFISAGFVSLQVGDYRRTGSQNREPDVVVDIYDMGKSIQAFGVLSDESGGKLTELQEGLTGFRTPSGMSFVKGKYYVRMASYDENASLDLFARRVAGAMGAGTQTQSEFSMLPDIGDVVATRYIKEAYRGLDFVNNVIEREYMRNGKKFQVAEFTGGKEKREHLVKSFVAYFNESDITFSRTEKEGREVYSVKDPYEGDWALIVSPDALYGVYGEYDKSVIEALVSDTGG